MFSRSPFQSRSLLCIRIDKRNFCNAYCQRFLPFFFSIRCTRKPRSEEKTTKHVHVECMILLTSSINWRRLWREKERRRKPAYTAILFIWFAFIPTHFISTLSLSWLKSTKRMTRYFRRRWSDGQCIALFAFVCTTAEIRVHLLCVCVSVWTSTDNCKALTMMGKLEWVRERATSSGYLSKQTFDHQQTNEWVRHPTKKKNIYIYE